MLTDTCVAFGNENDIVHNEEKTKCMYIKPSVMKDLYVPMFHFFLACPLYYRPRVTLLNALAHIAPLTVRILLHGNDTYEIEENKIIITETLRFIKESKRFD